MIVRYVIAWLPMVVIGIINGVIREQWYGNYLSERKNTELKQAVKKAKKKSFRKSILTLHDLKFIF
jgi:hypothetical protein